MRVGMLVLFGGFCPRTRALQSEAESSLEARPSWMDDNARFAFLILLGAGGLPSTPTIGDVELGGLNLCFSKRLWVGPLLFFGQTPIPRPLSP